MSFAIFRKYEKPVMWLAVIFTVAVFATFSGFSGLRELLARKNATSSYGQFVLQTNGETVSIAESEFQRVRLALNRFASASRSRENVTDNQVWEHIILREEARAAGIGISDHDIADFVSTRMFGGQPVTRSVYDQIWQNMLGFPSARDMEAFVGEMIAGERWREFQVEAGGLVNADDVYLQWREDNERFDYEAVVIPDLALEAVPEPTADDLKTMWDGLPEQVRTITYTDPRRVDIAYAWAPLAAGEHGVPDEKLAGVPEPTADQINARFEDIRAERFPQATALTDEIRATLTREARVAALAQKARIDFESGQDKTVDTFRKVMEDAGLTFADPAGLLGNDELSKLPDIGADLSSYQLAQTHVGQTLIGDPESGTAQTEVHVVFVQGEQPAKPLSFEESHDQLVKNWKQARRDQPAKDWREALRKAARGRPECVAVIQPLIDAATRRADEAAAALGKDATDDQRAAKRKEVLDLSENDEIKPRVVEFEHLVWNDVPRPDGSSVLQFSGVSRSYYRHPDGSEGAASIERALKTEPRVFLLAVDAVSEPIRRATLNVTAVVKVGARSFPAQTDMAADSAGLEASRKALSQQREMEAWGKITPDAVAASHQLRVAKPVDKDGKTPETPPDA